MIDGLGAGTNGRTIGMRGAVPLFAGGIYFGSYADYAVIEVVLVTPLPDALPFEDATPLLVQGLTALYPTRQAPPRGNRCSSMPQRAGLARSW